MAGYLMRLTMRTRPAGMTPVIQPFVRTASPIAAHDQRRAMHGFGSLDRHSASLSETSPEAGTEQGEILQPAAPAGITPGGETSRVAMRRNLANPAVILGSPAAFRPPDSNALTARSKNHEGAPSPTAARQVSNSPERVTPPRSGIDAPGEAGVHADSAPPPAPLVTDELPLRRPKRTFLKLPLPTANNTVVGHEWPALPTGDASVNAPSPRGFQGQGTEENSAQGARRAQQSLGIGSLRPRVPSRTPSDLAGPPFTDAATFRADEANDGPRIVIGRVNVEVVSPPATQPPTATPRSGPLTAASVSVIGPLGGGIRPNLQLSLRHR